MSFEALFLCSLCASIVAAISLLSSYVYRKRPNLTSTTMTFACFFPGFMLAIVALCILEMRFDFELVVYMIIKNIFYSVAFYLKYEALKKLGPFVGALMLGAQPIIVAVMGLFILGEALSGNQTLGIVLVTFALVLISVCKKEKHQAYQLSLNNLGLYFVVPSLLSSGAMVWDRFFLTGQISIEYFFILDRLLLLPSFAVVYLLVTRGAGLRRFLAKKNYITLIQNWSYLLVIGFLFTGSIYIYNLALSVEQVATVGLFRNSAYPVAAFIGVFLFKQRVSKTQWLSLFLVFISVLVGAN